MSSSTASALRKAGKRARAECLPEHEGAVSIGSDEKRALIERIARSPGLCGSPALQAFLRFVAGHAIAGTPASIKEQKIGSEVLGRKPDYDPAEDNIVRVRAHELRQRLARYFETDGATEPVVVVIPRGCYVPDFQFRAEPVVLKTPSIAPAVADEAFAAPPEKTKWFALWSGWLVAGVLATALLPQITAHLRKGSSFEAPALVRSSAVHDFWLPMFSVPNSALTIVAADATFALWQDVTGKNLDLGEYLGRKQLNSPGDSKFREVAARRCTSTADLNVAMRLTELAASLGGHTRMQYARSLNLHELQTANAVLIGSRRSNPWVELFESRLNFTLTRDARSGAPAFSNKQPRSNEPSTFTIPHMLDADGTEQNEMRSYAHIAFLPNLSATGYVLIFEGLNMEATEAAGEFLTNSEDLALLLQSLGHRPGEHVRPFEALLDLISVPGGFANAHVISARSLAK